MRENVNVSDGANRVHKRIVLFISMLGGFLTPFMGSAVNIALPSLGQEFNMGAVALSWTATAYLLAAAVFLVPFGRIADIFGRKRIYLYGILTFTVSSALCGLSTFTGMLIAFRVLQGIGSAMIFGTGVAILTSVFPPEERGKVLGLNVAVTYLGLSVGPFLGGFLTQNLGWRSIFFAVVPLGMAVTVFIFWRLKQEWAEAAGERFDLIGSLIYGLALTGIMYGFSLLPDLLGAGLIFAGIIGIAAFGIFEARWHSPVINVSLFRENKVFVFSSLAALINYCATYAVGFLLSLFLQYIKGMSPQTAGFILMAQPAVQAVLSPVAGTLSDRIEPKKVATAGMAVTTLALFSFIFLGEDFPLVLVIFILVILGFGLALFSSPNTNAIMSSVEKRFYGVASGMVGTMRLVGQMLSMGIAMLVFALHIGSATITPELYPQFILSTRMIFILLTILCFAGIFLSYARGRLRKDSATP